MTIRCKECNGKTKTVDTRATVGEMLNYVLRRTRCLSCDARSVTYELHRVDLIANSTLFDAPQPTQPDAG